MSGHSKWHKIQHKKGTLDAKRGILFTKLANTITIAARQGGSDPEMNFSLRLAIDKAKSANMPKENIERAIKRGTGEVEGAKLEEITYEGFGPDKIAIIIKCLTDNKNRTVAEIKRLLEKNGGSLVEPGSVMWMFKKQGVLIISNLPTNQSKETFELGLIDAGAEDIEINGGEILVYTKPEDLQKIKNYLEKTEIKVKSAEIELIAKEKIGVPSGVGEKIQKLFNELDEHQDVSNYYSNLS